MNTINCPICQQPLVVRIAHSRKSNKLFIMLKCEVDGRHFRGFISDEQFVKQVLESQPGITNSEVFR